MAKARRQCTDEELLQMLARRAVDRGEALDQTKPRKANAQCDVMADLSRELLRRGASIHPKILSMLENQNPHVKSWAAFLALEIDPPRGEQALEEISRNYPQNLNLGFTAEFTLKQWRKGKLRTLSQWGGNRG
jgi:Domain of unknown function (DUF2019)